MGSSHEDSGLSGAFARPPGRSGAPGPGPVGGSTSADIFAPPGAAGRGAREPDDTRGGTYEYGGHRRPAPASDVPPVPSTPPWASPAPFPGPDDDAVPPVAGTAGTAGTAGAAGSPHAAEQAPFDPDEGRYEFAAQGSDRSRSDHDRGRGGPGSSGSSGPTPPSRRRRLPVILGGGAAGLLVLVAGGVGLSAILKDDPPPKPSATPAAGQNAPAGAGTGATPAPSATPSTALGALIKSRTTDPKPLTVAEVFKRKTFTQQGTKYLMTAKNATPNCTKAVNGATFAKTLKKAGCTQVLRATFARSDGKLVGTIGVVNLKSEAMAKAAAKAASAKDAWVLPLAGGGTTKNIGTGIALGTAETRGHYLITTWVQQPSGKEMPAALRRQVTAFGRHVALGSNLSTTLQYRGITGKPYGT